MPWSVVDLSQRTCVFVCLNVIKVEKKVQKFIMLAPQREFPQFQTKLSEILLCRTVCRAELSRAMRRVPIWLLDIQFVCEQSSRFHKSYPFFYMSSYWITISLPKYWEFSLQCCANAKCARVCVGAQCIFVLLNSILLKYFAHIFFAFFRFVFRFVYALTWILLCRALPIQEQRKSVYFYIHIYKSVILLLPSQSLLVLLLPLLSVSSSVN